MNIDIKPNTMMKITIKLIFTLAAFAWMGIFSCTNSAIDSRSPADTIRFLAMGDYGRNGIAPQVAVADVMEKLAASKRINFVVALGDNFYPQGVASIHDPQWKTSFEDVYNGEQLEKLPWYAALGNHDYLLNPKAEIDYSMSSNRWRMPDYYYTVTFPLNEEMVRLVVMDTSPFEKFYYSDAPFTQNFVRDTAVQKQWLDSVFSKNDAAWTIVTGHHPLYTGGLRAKERNSVRASLLPLFIKHNLPVYFAGHEHDLQHLKPEGIRLNQFVNGAASEVNPTGSIESTKFSASALGVMAVEVTKSTMRVFVIGTKMDTLYQTSVER